MAEGPHELQEAKDGSISASKQKVTIMDVNISNIF